MSQQTILVVDDEPDFRELIAYQLQREGFAVSAAGDGLAALEKARWQTPDLILLDLMLPELDGLSVCEILRRHPATADIPIIMLTACGSPPLRQYGLENGARCYLTKPVAFAELVARVRGVLLGECDFRAGIRGHPLPAPPAG